MLIFSDAADLVCIVTCRCWRGRWRRWRGCGRRLWWDCGSRQKLRARWGT